jgi:hypothetical protein
MGIITTLVSLGLVAVTLHQVPQVDGLVNAIVPNLSTGWFAKPGPTESLIFGLLMMKVMALRYAGVFPYHLNDLWNEGGVLGDSFWNRNSRARRDLYFAKLNQFSKAPLLKEIEAVERILLGLRRIDSHDCFIRHVCQIKQNQLAGTASEYEKTILNIFSMRPKKQAVEGETSIWDIYHDALSPTVMDCSQKYKLCPLSKKDMKVQNLLSGLF